MNTYLNMLGGYGDRVARIALFDIFHHLENKLQKDDRGRPIDTFGVGLLSVLFFFENMLLRKKRTGVRELASFLQSMTNNQYELSEEGWLNLSKVIVDTLRPSSGKRLSRVYYNYETGKEETLEYALLKADEWDPDRKIQYYTLDEQGLELIFATKEYFSEFQISISQLMLRKQLEKGEFVGALRQVDEMRINVHTIRDRMVKIKHEIQRNIISDDTYERYKETIEDINRRLQQEQQEFQELVTFIHETRSHLDHQGSHSHKDNEALEMIVRVDNELAHVHYLHASLLKDSIELKTTAIEAAGESLYYAGVTAFNFDQEVARKMTAGPLPIVASKPLAMPFTKTAKFRTWSLLSVFAPQAMERPKGHKGMDFLELDDAGDSEDTLIRQQVNSLLFKELIQASDNKESIQLNEVIQGQDNPIFGTREFCDLWIVIHQLSPMDIKAIGGIEDHIFAKAFNDVLGDYEKITVRELDEDITLQGNYTMKNMIMELEGARS